MPIALDVMGGDFYPQIPVESALIAASEGIKVLLVGDETRIKKELEGKRFDASKIEIHHASEVIEMQESIVKAMRTKKDASMRVCFNLHKQGLASGVVSAGSSGGMLAIGKYVLKTLSGVDRPCISALMPSLTGKVLLLDAGANMDCTPQQLAQFASLGEIYMRVIHNIPEPRVGLLNIGSEEGKGDERSKRAYELLKLLPINFTGNIEGKEFFHGDVDVVVTDGFAGNVLLKSVQGAAKFILQSLKTEIEKSSRSKAGALLMKPAFNALKKRTDYQSWGGAPLLGMKGVGIVCHGSSDASAIAYGIRFAQWAAESNLTERMAESLAKSSDLLKPSSEK